ncbi:MAG: hypothetical protein AMXMBFR84_12920 [Candidatus Hydrogenedentota bacterium]
MTINVFELLARALYAGMTLYMIAILLRWLGPWLELDLRSGWWRTIPRVTDPLLSMLRGVLPSIGPMDFAPLAAVVGLWITRTILVGTLLGMAPL